MADDSTDEHGAMDFELPLALGPATNLFAPHKYLQKLLGLDTSDVLLTKIFAMLAALCDPLTQPEDNEKFPLSVEALGQIALSLSYQMLLSEREAETEEPNGNDWVSFENPEVASLRFTISLKYFTILQAINKVLRVDDELRVRYLQNDREDWEKTAHHWLPDVPSNAPHDPDACLKLLYYISCVLIMGLYKLFFPEDGVVYSAALNPYSEYFLRLWKTHTSIIALALEMDRELEEEAWATKSEYLDTPDIVKKALLGSSAVRTVLAWILEQVYPGAILDDGDSLNYDICKSPLLLFYDPLVRTANSCGCIMRDEQLLMVATLIIRSRISLSPVARESAPLAETNFPIFDASDYEFRVANRQTALGSAGDLMVDLYYHDQFDEDIKYVFGYYESDEESVSDIDDNDKVSINSEEMYGTAKRSKKDEIEFDEDGRDWRDCARGQNVDFTDRFLDLEANAQTLGEDSDHFFASWFELEQSFVFLASVKIESVPDFIQRVGQVTLNTVAKAVKDEMTKPEGTFISPNNIQLYLMSIARKELRVVAQEELPTMTLNHHTTFDLIFFRNPECALALLDELFMCKGLRRSLIWYFTRCMEFSMTLINYVYELVSGLRGNSPKREAKYTFSRNGALELSQVEKSMALHELFERASRWALGDASRSSIPEQNTIKLVRCLCLMISRLIQNGTIKQNTEDSYEDYSHDLQVLLFPWIGRVPEARELFFKIKSDSYRRLETEDVHATEKRVEEAKLTKNSKDLDILSVLKKLENLDVPEYWDVVDEPAIQLAFREFSQRLFYHICRIYKVENVDLKPFETSKSAQEDFYIFLTRFNDFSKNKTFVRNIFSLLEGVSVGERPEQKESEDAEFLSEEIENNDTLHISETEPVESEFNDAFLNGEGHFQDGEQEKNDDKKKKKKKKKRRGKR
ncbi:hypothetical protein JCM33374_g6566 [Metschnikowia sp. JCM 33374]|nr:hypothetical protein JCM33374_g6566 [Metschnikowia sp. JCM 33374]